MKDGPSLGGFVCIATVAEDEMWKLGQLQVPVIIYPASKPDSEPNPEPGSEPGPPRPRLARPHRTTCPTLYPATELTCVCSVHGDQKRTVEKP